MWNRCKDHQCKRDTNNEYELLQKKNMTANLYFLGRTKAVSLRVSFWYELSVNFILRLHEQKLVPV